LLSSAEDGIINLWNLSQADPKQSLVKSLETPSQKLNKDSILNNF